MAPAGRSPTSSLAAVTTPGRPHRAFSSATAASTRLLKRVVERGERGGSTWTARSTSIQASDGIALTDVPPPMRPTLNVVCGSPGT